MTYETQQIGTAAEHTPGPWRVVPGSVVSDGRMLNGHPVFVASYGSADYDERSAEIKANARLIAAAPALLDELIALTDYLAYLGVPEDGADKYEAACAAIRAARGEE